jgi:hypothetical protein
MAFSSCEMALPHCSYQSGLSSTILLHNPSADPDHYGEKDDSGLVKIAQVERINER